MVRGLGFGVLGFGYRVSGFRTVTFPSSSAMVALIS